MEEITEYPIMVPYDFTPVSDVALAHASNIGLKSNRSLKVVNIVDNSTRKFLKSNNLSDKNLPEKLEEICRNVREKYNIPASFLIKKGSISSMRKIAENLVISSMFIGIDQPQSGASQILKLIGKCPAPVYVVQGDIEWKPIKTIIFPVDEFEETRQKISVVFRLAAIENVVVKLLSITLRNRDFQICQEVRVKQIEKKLYKEKIAFTTEYAKLDKKVFADELLEYAQANNGDVMILMKTPRIYFSNMYISKFDKKILLNSKHIPSIYVNALDLGLYTRH